MHDTTTTTITCTVISKDTTMNTNGPINCTNHSTPLSCIITKSAICDNNRRFIYLHDSNINTSTIVNKSGTAEQASIIYYVIITPPMILAVLSLKVLLSTSTEESNVVKTPPKLALL